MYSWMIIVLVIIVISKLTKPLRLKFFAKFMDVMTKKRDKDMAEFKGDFMKPLLSITSHDPQLRKEKAIRILEVGVGTGGNFEFYPDNTRLIVVDPNPYFKDYYDENRKKFSNIHSEEIIVAYGEEMDMIESNSVDAVVITHVLCSVLDNSKVAEQIKRVLAPGGKFFFFEHVKEFEPSKYYIRAFLQELFTRLGIFPYFFANCHLNRLTLPEIEAAGFSKVEAKLVHAPIKHWFLQIIMSHVLGVATK